MGLTRSTVTAAFSVPCFACSLPNSRPSVEPPKSLHGGPMHFRKAALFLFFLLAGPLLSLAQNTLSLDDVAKIRAVHKKYEETWLSGDADGVRALFTDDSVLLPP